jgi:hypothetical protein
MNYQNISRFIFLLLILVLSVYFIYINKNLKKTNYETFYQAAASTQDPTPQQGKAAAVTDSNKPNLTDLSQNTDVQNTQIITDIYKKLFNQTPVKDEIAFYLDYIKSRTLTEQELEDIIATTAQVLRKTIPETQSSVTYGTEDSVIMTYNEILGRNPDQSELLEYSEKISKDKTFTMEKLIQLLVSSQEYIRLEKMQTNTYNAGLIGGVTDRQITMTIDQIYTNVTGKQIDQDTMQFLKKKFISFNLDEKKLTNFIKSYVSNTPYNQDTTSNKSTLPNLVAQEHTSQEQASQAQASQGQASQAQASQAQASQAQAQAQKNSVQGTSNQQIATGQPIFNNAQIYVVSPNQDLINSLLKNTNENYVDSQSVLDTINSKAQCNFDKNTKQKDETMLSDEINNRNFQELQSACTRNSAFLNPDSEYTLRPDQKWTVPAKRAPVCSPSSKCQVVDSTDQSSLIGTLIPDAKKTSIGSILPYLPPR